VGRRGGRVALAERLDAPLATLCGATPLEVLQELVARDGEDERAEPPLRRARGLERRVDEGEQRLLRHVLGLAREPVALEPGDARRPALRAERGRGGRATRLRGLDERPARGRETAHRGGRPGGGGGRSPGKRGGGAPGGGGGRSPGKRGGGGGGGSSGGGGSA